MSREQQKEESMEPLRLNQIVYVIVDSDMTIKPYEFRGLNHADPSGQSIVLVDPSLRPGDIPVFMFCSIGEIFAAWGEALAERQNRLKGEIRLWELRMRNMEGNADRCKHLLNNPPTEPIA